MLSNDKVVVPSRRTVHTPQRKVAVVLAGCGAKDGAEITEAVSLLVALSEAGIEARLFAPNRPLHHTIDHLHKKEVAEKRNILVEAARIARGDIAPIESLDVARFDALAFGGGFGVAKNLCNYAFAEVDARLFDDVKVPLVGFLRAKKPVAALCIAPIVVALGVREIGIKSAKLTLGDGSDKAAVSAIEKWGLRHVPCANNEACVDTENRLVSSPAYMLADATPADIFASARALVAGLDTLWGVH